MLLKQPEPRLDPRMKRTRQMLRAALMELIQEKSFQSITVQDIAERATVNRATFYDHFVDKFALLEYAVRETFVEDLSGKLPGETYLSVDALRTLVEIVCTFMRDGHKHCKPVDEQLLRLVESQITGELIAVLHGWLDEALRPDATDHVSSELTANMIGWAIFGAARHWQQDKAHRPIPEFAREMLPVLTASLHHAFVIDGLGFEN